MNSNLVLQRKILKGHPQGFSLVELLIVVTILGIIASIAVPQYTNYISGTRKKAADNALEQFSVLLEQYRAENGQFPNNNTYDYTETNGVEDFTANPISGQLPSFIPRAASADATSFHYSMKISNTGTTTEQAEVKIIGVGSSDGINTSNTFY